MHKDNDLCNRGENLNELIMHREGNDLLIAGVEGARDYAQSLKGLTRTILWDVLDLTRRTDGHPEQIGALVIIVRAFRSVIVHGLCAVE